MNIIFVPKTGGRSNSLKLTPITVYFLMFLMLSLFAGVMLTGYWLGHNNTDQGPAVLVDAWKSEMAKQRQEIVNARHKVAENMDAMAMRLGRLQAHVMRIDALGERLTKVAKINDGEFDFGTPPAQGGPRNLNKKRSASMQAPDFMKSLNKVSGQLESRAQQLSFLETMLMTRGLENEVFPAGRPIKSGWLSSYYGMRTDPFTGRQERHKGLDFAGKMGSDVIAVASGVVTWAGRRYGYGNLVEVNHGNGFSTRYGHSQEVLVSVGDAVKKGQSIALMGSTGRSTGPHVHFEVLRDGKTVDPMQYIKSAKSKK